MNSFSKKNLVRKIKKNKIIEEYFHHRRWQLLTLMEKISGFWPQQSKLIGFSLRTFHVVVIMTIFLAAANKMYEYIVEDDAVMIVECYVTLMFLSSIIVKLTFACSLQRKRQEIYQMIRRHFELITDHDEAKILEEYTDRGFIYTATYIGLACIGVVIFDSVPILRSFFNHYFGNEKLNMQLPIQLNYGFDHSKYWYLVMLDFLMFVVSGCIVDFSYDLSFILQVHHVQALSKIVEYRLKKASDIADEFGDEAISKDTAEKIYSLINSVIELHTECLELINMIENSYSINWFVILLMNTSVFGAGVHLITMRLHDKIETFRNFFAFMILLMHFFVVFSQGENVSNSNSAVAFACYDCRWYKLPKKSSKPLMIMMMRSSIPNELTGAKLFPLSMESFGKMLKAGLSYYTVFQR